MLLRILGPVEVNSKPGLSQQFEAGEFVDIPGAMAKAAIAQGAAVPASMAEVLAAAPQSETQEPKPEAAAPRAKSSNLKPKKET